VVNQAFVRKFLSGDPHPLERVLSFDEKKVDPTAIVGVVPDIHHQGVRGKIVPTVYLPIAQKQLWFGDITGADGITGSSAFSCHLAGGAQLVRG